MTEEKTVIEQIVLAVSNGRNHWSNFILVSAVLGFIVLIRWTIGFFSFIWRNCFRKCCQSKDRLYQMYGLNSE